MLFGKKKKEKIRHVEKIVFSHPLVGEMQYWNDISEWQTTKTYKFQMFNKEFDVDIIISSDGSSAEFSEKQETALKMIINSIDALQKSAEEALSSYFKVENPAELMENIDIENISVTKHGDICLSILSSFDDDILDFIPDEPPFTDSFGISVFPEAKVLPSEGDYDDFLDRV